MSIIVTYTAFDEKNADAQWENFEDALEGAKRNRSKIGALEKKFWEELQPTDDEIYDKRFAAQRDLKAQRREEVRKEIERLSLENKILESWLMDEIEQGHFTVDEQNLIQIFIQADLAFGTATEKSFDLRELKMPASSLLVMFPEFGNGDVSDLTTDQWFYVFRHKDELQKRALEHREYLADWADTDEEFKEYTRDLGIFLQGMKPVIEKAMLPGFRLVVTSDAGGVEDEAFIARAKAHIAQLKAMPKFKNLFV